MLCSLRHVHSINTVTAQSRNLPRSEEEAETKLSLKLPHRHTGSNLAELACVRCLNQTIISSGDSGMSTANGRFGVTLGKLPLKGKGTGGLGT